MKLKALTCPNCGDTVDVKSEEQKFVFCSTCGSKLVVDDEVQRIEHTVSGTVRVEGLDKVNELAQHIGSAGGGSMLAKAQSMAKAGFMSMDRSKFERALETFSDCTLALAGLVITAPLPAYVKKLQLLAPDITQDECDIIDGNDSYGDYRFLCAFAKSGLLSRCQYIVDKHKKLGDANTFINTANKEVYDAELPIKRAETFETVQWFIENGARVDNETGKYLLEKAISDNDIKRADYLLAKGAKIDRSDGNTYLLAKVINNNMVHMAELLVSNGVGFNTYSEVNWSTEAASVAIKAMEPKKMLEIALTIKDESKLKPFFDNGLSQSFYENAPHNVYVSVLISIQSERISMQYEQDRVQKMKNSTNAYERALADWQDGAEIKKHEKKIDELIDTLSFMCQHGAKLWVPYAESAKILDKKMPQGETALTFAIDRGIRKVIEAIFRYIPYDEAQQHARYAKKFCKLNKETAKLVIKLAKEKKK